MQYIDGLSTRDVELLKVHSAPITPPDLRVAAVANGSVGAAVGVLIAIPLLIRAVRKRTTAP